MVISLFKQRTFLLKVLPIVIAVIILKVIIFNLHWELFAASPLLSGIVTANMFLLGFLLAGVLADYKESEKLPGELASSLDVLVDECIVVSRNKNDKKAKECAEHVRSLEHSIRLWMLKKESLEQVMEKISGLNAYVAHFEAVAHASTITRMKAEQNNIRRIMTRISVIRDTSFVSAGYAIAEGVTLFLIIGLLFVRVDKLYEAVFFVSIITFVLTYMVNLIKDLDNPFEYYEKERGGDEISLAPLDAFEAAIEKKMAEFS